MNELNNKQKEIVMCYFGKQRELSQNSIKFYPIMQIYQDIAYTFKIHERSVYRLVSKAIKKKYRPSPSEIKKEIQATKEKLQMLQQCLDEYNK